MFERFTTPSVSLKDWQWYFIYIFILVTVGVVWGLLQSNKQVYVVELVELSARANFLNTTNLLDKPAAEALERLIRDAETGGVCLVVTDGYRTHEEQQSIIDAAKEKGREQYVAAVGESEHHTGRAVDLGGCSMTDGVRDDNAERLELRNNFDTLPEYQWLVENGSKYGFHQTYTADNEHETGMPAEPWHWLYRETKID